MAARAPDDRLDIAVRGAGPVGCAVALALRGSGHRIAVFEAGPAPAGFRPIALSHASRLILERLDVWHGLAATPIETVQVSQTGAFGRTRLEANEAGVPALGYVVDYAALATLLRAAIEMHRGVEPTGVRCTIHAEGFSEGMREKRYGQDAVVGLVELSTQARSTAYERFTNEGPLALLPISGRYALIWSAAPPRCALSMPCRRCGDFFRAA
jgi:2-octaprenyl-6-methoxyphenol hydroxylase